MRESPLAAFSKLAFCLIFSVNVQAFDTGSMLSPPHNEIGNMSQFLVPGKWETIANAMVWTEGPTWWNDELVFSDTRLGKIFSWNPKTKQVGVILELAGNKNRNTGIVLEPFSNGLKVNPVTDELLICEHGNRGISALNRNGTIRKLPLRDIHGIDWNFNSPNDIAVHHRTGDIYFTDPIFGRMTFNANNARGNLDEIPGLDNPGFSGVYKYHAKSGITSLVTKDMVTPNGIAISGDRLVVSNCNKTSQELWEFKILDDDTVSEPRILASFTRKFMEKGNPDGFDIDEFGNIWTSGPGGLLIVDKNGQVVARDILAMIKVSNVFLAPDGWAYLTGSHGVYRRKRNLKMKK